MCIRDSLRHRKAERICSLEVNDQLDLCGLLDRQVGRLLALEYPPGVDANQTVWLLSVASVAHQAAGRGELAIFENRGHRVAERQCSELFAPTNEEWIGADHECARSKLDNGCE